MVHQETGGEGNRVKGDSEVDLNKQKGRVSII